MPTKFMKPVLNNGQVDSPLQFKVKHDTNIAKKVRPRNVFEYTGNKDKDNIKKRLRSANKK
tara:strand:- start:31 stop:213 length:183 start_codon:yes stop_codon:yes gene_type:complete